jgi:ferredoxin
MAKRKIVAIDEAKCDGCGLCVPSCAEGAIQIIDGKARLVADVYCDGLGACLGECPNGAITITEREAEPFDEEAVRARMVRLKADQSRRAPTAGCPGAAAQSLPGRSLPMVACPTGTPEGESSGSGSSALQNWPVQLHLVPPGAPFLKDRDLLLVADCVPFACAEFHGRLLRGRPVVVGCPKLDDPQSYVDKLCAILAASSIKSLSVVRMEVPCCSALVRIAEAAMKASGVNVPLEEVTISIQGEILDGES